MARQNSFDIVSKTDLAEVDNAVGQTLKEVRQRYDFKGSISDVRLENNDLVLRSDDDYRLKALIAILEQKLVRRKISLRALSYGKIGKAAGGTLRQSVAIQQGIPGEKARQINKFIRNLKLKVQASIQGDSVRVTHKNRDLLQEVIGLLKKEDFGIDMQFTNYRSR